jgi:hypothetical protein
MYWKPWWKKSSSHHSPHQNPQKEEDESLIAGPRGGGGGAPAVGSSRPVAGGACSMAGKKMQALYLYMPSGALAVGSSRPVAGGACSMAGKKLQSAGPVPVHAHRRLLLQRTLDPTLCRERTVPPQDGHGLLPATGANLLPPGHLQLLLLRAPGASLLWPRCFLASASCREGMMQGRRPRRAASAGACAHSSSTPAPTRPCLVACAR